MRIVYIAAPVGADTQQGVDVNIARALRWYRWACDTHADCAFVMNWYVDIAVYPDADAGPTREGNDQRQRGLDRDDAVIRVCDEYWMVAGRISGGMERGSAVAEQAGIRVVDLTALGDEPPIEGPFSVPARASTGNGAGQFRGEF